MGIKIQSFPDGNFIYNVTLTPYISSGDIQMCEVAMYCGIIEDLDVLKIDKYYDLDLHKDFEIVKRNPQVKHKNGLIHDDLFYTLKRTMKIDKVTITGADNNTSIEEMLKIAKEFPFVEFGILFSESRVGTNRYPTLDWIINLIQEDDIQNNNKSILNLSGHICGKYTRDFLSSGPDFLKELYSPLKKRFKRFQLNYNFAKNQEDVNLVYFLNRVDHHEKLSDSHFILQMNKSNSHFINEVILKYVKEKDKYFHYLFDASGGNGILREWQEPLEGVYCGYAGGLTPDNIDIELLKINQKVGNSTIWIDVESGVRTDDKLDLDKVRKFLKSCQQYITK